MTNVCNTRSQRTDFAISQNHIKQNKSFFNRIITISFLSGLLIQANQNHFAHENKSPLLPYLKQVKGIHNPSCEPGYQRLTPDLSSFMYNEIMLTTSMQKEVMVLTAHSTPQKCKYEMGWIGCIIQENLLTQDECSSNTLDGLALLCYESYKAKQKKSSATSIFDFNEDRFMSKRRPFEKKDRSWELCVRMEPQHYQNHLSACNYLGGALLQANDFFEKDEKEILEIFNEVHRLITQDLTYNEKHGVTPGKFRTGFTYIMPHKPHPPAPASFLFHLNITQMELDAYAEMLHILNENNENKAEYAKLNGVRLALWERAYDYNPKKNLILDLTNAIKKHALDDNRSLYEKLTPQQAGIWKGLLGCAPEPQKIPILMLNFVKTLKQHVANKTHPIALAAWVHCHLVGIHPYGDSNGKTARLLMNAILARSGYQPIVFPNESSYNYAASRDNIDPGYFAKFLIEDVIPWNKKNIKPPIKLAIC